LRRPALLAHETVIASRHFEKLRLRASSSERPLAE
jgi:hypothetical protein